MKKLSRKLKAAVTCLNPISQKVAGEVDVTET